MVHPLGAIPRDPDPRDFLVSKLLAPTTLTARRWSQPIQIDQGVTGTCVANAWTHYLTDSPIQHQDNPLLDPALQPSVAKYGSYYQYWDENGQPRAAEKYAIDLYDSIHDGILEPLDPGREAGANTVDGAVILKRRGLVSAYYRAVSVDEVIQCILTKSPVVFASAWYNSMDNPYGISGIAKQRYLSVNLGSGIRGYHAYLLDAVDLNPDLGPPYVRLKNSWGLMWGRRGTARVTIEDLHSLFINNAFIATEQPS